MVHSLHSNEIMKMVATDVVERQRRLKYTLLPNRGRASAKGCTGCGVSAFCATAFGASLRYLKHS